MGREPEKPRMPLQPQGCGGLEPFLGVDGDCDVKSAALALVSAPFPEHERVGICARAKSDASVRVLRLPLTLVQSGRDHQEVKAA